MKKMSLGAMIGIAVGVGSGIAVAVDYAVGFGVGIAIFVVVTLLLLMAAVWIGITLASQLATPIISLIKAAEKVSEGDLSIRVHVTEKLDEISTLSRTFNTMTEQIESQRNGLIDANQQLDERRRFTETVLSGVSAGVIGLDTSGNIHLPNRSASSLLSTNLKNKTGYPKISSQPPCSLESRYRLFCARQS